MRLERTLLTVVGLPVAVALAGALGAATGSLDPMAGFGLWTFGLLVAGLSGLAGGLLLRLKGGSWRPVLLGGVALVLLFAPALPGMGKPPINDITTDVVDPPRLDDAKAPGGIGLDMDYDPAFAAVTKESYPDLAAVPFVGKTDVGLDRAASCLEKDGGRGLFRGPSSVQATYQSRVFRFRDDAVIRLEDGRFDLRSRSRDGKGDLGVNAARIQRLATCLR